MKTLLLILVPLLNIIYATEYEPIASCSNAKSELINLSTGKTDGYKKDSMTIDLVWDKKTKSVFVKSNSSTSKLMFLGDSNYFQQFLEPVASGHHVLYTLHSRKLTIQKSYSLLGTPVMVNTILDCK